MCLYFAFRFRFFSGSMNLGSLRFNSYLLALILAVAAVGCKTSEEKEHEKEASTLRFYLETDYDTGNKTTVVPIFRASPILIRINKEPVLDEGHIIDALVVDVVGGFAIQVKFDFRGTLTLESISSTYRGQRLAIYSMFTEGRWLAAPKMTVPIKDGVITFTPDATRDEAVRIVRGLNNLAIQLGNKPKPGKEKKRETF